jgi:hypothetical protein
MSISSSDLAKLADDAYLRHGRGAIIEVSGAEYEIVKQVSKPSGYQGTLYRNTQTNEFVIGHRGTQFELSTEGAKDLLLADGGMVFSGVNVQAADAMAFTRTATTDAGAYGLSKGFEPSITLTGHSLGGTLAQITAHELGLRGETFNAFGAADLLHGVPEGGSQVVNHVRAVDLVSAASRHFGEVRVYATQRDIAYLSRHGYENQRGLDLRAPLSSALSGYVLEAHGIETFHKPDPASGTPILDAENLRRFDDNRLLVGRFRDDIRHMRQGLSGPWQLLHPLLSDNAHPGHGLYQDALHGMRQLDAQQGRASDDGTIRAAGSLVPAAAAAGMERIDQVVLSDDRRFLFAVQGDLHDPTNRYARMDTSTAFAQPLEESSRLAEQQLQAKFAEREALHTIERQPSFPQPAMRLA